MTAFVLGMYLAGLFQSNPVYFLTTLPAAAAAGASGTSTVDASTLGVGAIVQQMMAAPAAFVQVDAIMCEETSPVLDRDFDKTLMKLRVNCGTLDLWAPQEALVALIQHTNVMAAGIAEIIEDASFENADDDAGRPMRQESAAVEQSFEDSLGKPRSDSSSGGGRVRSSTLSHDPIGRSDTLVPSDAPPVREDVVTMDVSAQFKSMRVLLAAKGSAIIEAEIAGLQLDMVQNAAEMNVVLKMHDLEVRDLSAAGARYQNILTHGESTKEVLDVQFTQYTTPRDGYGSDVTVTVGTGAEIIFLQRWVAELLGFLEPITSTLAENQDAIVELYNSALAETDLIDLIASIATSSVHDLMRPERVEQIKSKVDHTMQRIHGLVNDVIAEKSELEFDEAAPLMKIKAQIYAPHITVPVSSTDSSALIVELGAALVTNSFVAVPGTRDFIQTFNVQLDGTVGYVKGPPGTRQRELFAIPDAINIDAHLMPEETLLAGVTMRPAQEIAIAMGNLNLNFRDVDTDFLMSILAQNLAETAVVCVIDEAAQAEAKKLAKQLQRSNSYDDDVDSVDSDPDFMIQHSLSHAGSLADFVPTRFESESVIGSDSGVQDDDDNDDLMIEKAGQEFVQSLGSSIKFNFTAGVISLGLRLNREDDGRGRGRIGSGVEDRSPFASFAIRGIDLGFESNTYELGQLAVKPSGSSSSAGGGNHLPLTSRIGVKIEEILITDSRGAEYNSFPVILEAVHATPDAAGMSAFSGAGDATGGGSSDGGAPPKEALIEVHLETRPKLLRIVGQTALRTDADVDTWVEAIRYILEEPRAIGGGLSRTGFGKIARIQLNSGVVTGTPVAYIDFHELDDAGAAQTGGDADAGDGSGADTHMMKPSATAQALRYLCTFQEQHKSIYQFADFAEDAGSTNIQVAMRRTELFLDGDFFVKLLRFAPSAPEEDEQTATSDATAGDADGGGVGAAGDEAVVVDAVDVATESDFDSSVGKPSIVDWFIQGRVKAEAGKPTLQFQAPDRERMRLNSPDMDVRLEVQQQCVHLLEDPRSTSTRAIILEWDADVHFISGDAMRVSANMNNVHAISCEMDNRLATEFVIIPKEPNFKIQVKNPNMYSEALPLVMTCSECAHEHVVKYCHADRQSLRGPFVCAFEVELALR